MLVRAMVEIDSTYPIDESRRNDDHQDQQKRTSVIDIWRQRERSAATGGVLKSPSVPSKPISRNEAFSGSPRQNHIGKRKENSSDANETVTAERYSSPNIRNHHNIVSPRSSSSKVTHTPIKAVNDIRNDEVKPLVAPITPETPTGTTSPAFGDLKSKWANFGKTKVQTREDLAVSPQVHETSASMSESRENESSGRITDPYDSTATEISPQGGRGLDLSGERNSSVSGRPHHTVLESSRRPNHPRRSVAGWSKPKPSSKVVTKMYVKDRTKANPADAAVESPSRLGRLSQKKQLLEKVRRRNKAAAGRTDLGASQLTTSEDTDDEEQIHSFKGTPRNKYQHQRAAAQASAAESVSVAPLMTIERGAVKSELPFDCNNVQSDSDHPLSQDATLESFSETDTKVSISAAYGSEVLQGSRQCSPKSEHSANSRSLAPSSFEEDEMMILDEEQGQRNVAAGPNHPDGHFRPISPETIEDDSTTTSHMVSTITGFSEANNRHRNILADAIVADQFVVESASNVEAFQTTLKSLSLQQLASDLSEEAGTVLKGVDLQKISNDLNNGFAAASRSLTAATHSLNKFAGTNERRKKVPLLPRRHRDHSPVEEVAIEVEYVEDDD